MIRFNQQTIKCGHLHSSLHPTDGELQRTETYFWGLQGTSEIRSYPGSYDVETVAWIHDATFIDRTKLVQYIRDLRNLRGSHGILEETMSDGIKWETFNFATFLGFEATALPGQDNTPQPVPDEAGCVMGIPNVWVIQGRLRWRILRSDP